MNINQNNFIINHYNPQPEMNLNRDELGFIFFVSLGNRKFNNRVEGHRSPPPQPPSTSSSIITTDPSSSSTRFGL